MNLNFIGNLNSLFSLGYTCSKLWGGPVADFYSSRLMLAIPLLLSGLVCILFTVIPLEYVITLEGLWFLNGSVQALAWFPIAM